MKRDKLYIPKEDLARYIDGINESKMTTVWCLGNHVGKLRNQRRISWWGREVKPVYPVEVNVSKWIYLACLKY